MSESAVPPELGRFDAVFRDRDPVAFALERVKTHVRWVNEHLAEFERQREGDPAKAAAELDYLRHSACEAEEYVGRLVELLLAGHAIDPAKRLPREFARRLRARESDGGGCPPPPAGIPSG